MRIANAPATVRCAFATAALVLAAAFAAPANASPPQSEVITSLDPGWDDGARRAIDAAWSMMPTAPHRSLEMAELIIAGYEQRYPAGRTRWYSASDEAEAARYRAIDAIARDPAYDDAKALVNVWGEAYHVKAYALIEMALARGTPGNQKATSAKPALDPDLASRARDALMAGLVLQPYHVRMRNELGYLEQVAGLSDRALETFRMAELAARDARDEEGRAGLTRAMRGIGFALIELDRLDEAEAKFREVLAIDPDDQYAKDEIRYIEAVRKERADR